MDPDNSSSKPFKQLPVSLESVFQSAGTAKQRTSELLHQAGTAKQRTAELLIPFKPLPFPPGAITPKYSRKELRALKKHPCYEKGYSAVIHGPWKKVDSGSVCQKCGGFVMASRILSASNALKILRFITRKPELVWVEENDKKAGPGIYSAWLRTEVKGDNGVFSTIKIGWMEQSMDDSYGWEHENFQIRLTNNLGGAAEFNLDTLPESPEKKRIYKGMELIIQRHREEVALVGLSESEESREDYEKLVEKMRTLDLLP